MTKKRNSGFSLVEMMVVVGIMSILAMVAVPNLMRFQSKAKQANAKTELATVYGLEKAFQVEFSGYTNNLIVLGYSPDGVPLDGTGCPKAVDATWPTRYYNTGFPADGGDVNVPTTIQNVCPKSQTVSAAPATTTTQPTKIGFGSAADFTVEAWGNIGGSQSDQWTINATKVLANKQVGY